MKKIIKLSIIFLFLFSINSLVAQVVKKNRKPETVESPKEAVAPEETIEIDVVETVDSLQTNDSDDVFVFVEVQPVFPGGDDARPKYLRENIHYPKDAKEAGIQGTVYVSFIIEKDGRVTNVKVLRGIGGGCDKESVRVISNMPNWTPGTQRGKAVRVQYNMPIRFVLAGSVDPKPLTKAEKKALKKKQKKEAKDAKKKADTN